VEVRAVQDLAGHRVEEGLGQFGLVVVDQEADVVQLDLVPDVHGLGAGVVFLLQPAHAFLDAQVVELDALALGALLAVPVGGFEAVLGPRGLGAEQAVVAIEAIHHRLGDVVRLGRVESLREHGLPADPAEGLRAQPRRVAATPAMAALYSESRPSVPEMVMCRSLMSPSFRP